LAHWGWPRSNSKCARHATASFVAASLSAQQIT